MSNAVLTSNLDQVWFYDLNSGQHTYLGSTSATYRNLYDIAINPITHEAYGMDGGSVYHLNFNSDKKITLDYVGMIPSTGVSSLSFDASGHLFMSGGTVYQMDLTTGASTKLTDWGGPMVNGDLAIVGHKMYATSPYYAKMYMLDLDTMQKSIVASGLPANPDGMVIQNSQTYIFHDNKVTAIDLNTGSSRDIISATDTKIFTGASSLTDNLLKIDGQLVSLGTDGNAAQVYRLYQAALGRTPDAGGIAYHTNAVNNGVSLHDDAASFINSLEFSQRYGANSSDQAFVAALYQNVLGRTPDTAGNTYWVNALASHTMDRATVLVGFSESQENHGKVDPTIQTGIHLDYGLLS